MNKFIYTILHKEKPMFIVAQHPRFDITTYIEGYLTGLGYDWTYDDYESAKHIDLPILSFTKD